jgi:CRP/FNR family cyclic AMP-dependent transcriptional regulator
MTALIARFQGADGRSHAIDALLKQPIVGGDAQIAARLIDEGELVSFAPGTEFIKQGDVDFCLYMVLMGTATINLNGRSYLDRGSGTHIGEMSLIDVTKHRSATVVAGEPIVALKIPESVFTSIARAFPGMWRNIAIELGDRLRQRNTLLRERNAIPRVFIGSSSEGLPEANAIKASLPGLPVLDVQVWSDGLFRPSSGTIETLAASASDCDFAILVLRDDDLTVSRGKKSLSPRDNVTFELGLFVGALGMKRTFIVHQKRPRPPNTLKSRLFAYFRKAIPWGYADSGIKLPSDLAGVTTVTYELGPDSTLAARLAPACAQIAAEIEAQGVR